MIYIRHDEENLHRYASTMKEMGLLSMEAVQCRSIPQIVGEVPARPYLAGIAVILSSVNSLTIVGLSWFSSDTCSLLEEKSGMRSCKTKQGFIPGS